MCGFDSCYPWLRRKFYNNYFLKRYLKVKKYNNYILKIHATSLVRNNFNKKKILSNPLFKFRGNFLYKLYKFNSNLDVNNSTLLLKQLTNSSTLSFFFSASSQEITSFAFFKFKFALKNSFLMSNLIKNENHTHLYKYLYFFFSNNFFNFYKIKNVLPCVSSDRKYLKNRSQAYFNFYRRLPLNSFTRLPLFKTTHNKLFINKIQFVNLFKYKNLNMLSLFLNNSLFKNVCHYNKNRTSSTFMISRFDVISQNFIKLTQSTKRIATYDFFKINQFRFGYLFNINKVLFKLNFGDKFVQNNTIFSRNSASINFENQSLFGSSSKTTLFELDPFSENTKSIFNPFGTFNRPALTLFNSFESLCFLFFKPVFIKYTFLIALYGTKNDKPFNTLLSNFMNSFSSVFFYDSKLTKNNTNLIPDLNLNYFIKKTVIKIFSFDKFSGSSTPWHYQALIKFLEYCSGRKACVKLNGFLNNSLSLEERARCLMWSQKVKYFKKVLGPKLFLNESIQIMYLALRDKDPYIFTNWMVTTMYKISFWKYKTFLRYIKYVLRYFFWSIFSHLKIRGIKFQLKGKISVAGNARTRTAFHYVGFTSHATFDNKILYNLSLVKSFTGVMGLKLWIVF